MYDQIQQLKSKDVVIDCGHTKIARSGKTLRVGLEVGPSATEIATLEEGVKIAQALKQMGRFPVINICFSNRESFELSSEMIQELRDALPNSYRNILDSSGLQAHEIQFTFQSTHRNRFAKMIKKLKNRIRTNSLSTEQIFEKHKALFCRDAEGDLFSVVLPLLNDSTSEATSNDSDEDDFDDLRERDLITDPLIRLKQTGIIHLQSNSQGVLCPGTYGGLILGSAPGVDHIAIYSRADDAYIGEKITRGALAAFALKSDDQRTCLLIVKQAKSKKAEISVLTRNELNRPSDPSLERLQNAFMRKPSLKGFGVFH